MSYVKSMWKTEVQKAPLSSKLDLQPSLQVPRLDNHMCRFAPSTAFYLHAFYALFYAQSEYSHLL